MQLSFCFSIRVCVSFSFLSFFLSSSFSFFFLFLFFFYQILTPPAAAAYTLRSRRMNILRRKRIKSALFVRVFLKKSKPARVNNTAARSILYSIFSLSPNEKRARSTQTWKGTKRKRERNREGQRLRGGGGRVESRCKRPCKCTGKLRSRCIIIRLLMQRQRVSNEIEFFTCFCPWYTEPTFVIPAALTSQRRILS